MSQGPVHDKREPVTATPADRNLEHEMHPPASTPADRELEREIDSRTRELTRLISRLSSSVRGLVARSAAETIREAAGELPEMSVRPQERSQSFWVLGLVLVACSILLSLVYRGFAFLGVVGIFVGVAITVVGLAARAIRRRRSEPPLPPGPTTSA